MANEQEKQARLEAIAERVGDHMEKNPSLYNPDAEPRKVYEIRARLTFAVNHDRWPSPDEGAAQFNKQITDLLCAAALRSEQGDEGFLIGAVESNVSVSSR